MRLGIALGLLAFVTVPIGLEPLTSERRSLQAIGKPVTLAGAAMFFAGLILEW